MTCYSLSNVDVDEGHTLVPGTRRIQIDLSRGGNMGDLSPHC